MPRTQRDKVLQYMKDFGKITPLDAFRDLGCMRLGARIYELKERGHKIDTRIVATKNAYGQVVHYAEYSLTKGDKNE